MSDDLISRSALLVSLRGNVLVDVTSSLEEAIEGQPTVYDLDEVVEAMEKKTLEKPYMQSDGDADGYPVWDTYCPTCGYDFDGTEPKYCPECGQAILWGQNDE